MQQYLYLCCYLLINTIYKFPVYKLVKVSTFEKTLHSLPLRNNMFGRMIIKCRYPKAHEQGAIFLGSRSATHEQLSVIFHCPSSHLSHVLRMTYLNYFEHNKIKWSKKRKLKDQWEKNLKVKSTSPQKEKQKSSW